jgi:hypothetical protein
MSFRILFSFLSMWVPVLALVVLCTSGARAADTPGFFESLGKLLPQQQEAREGRPEIQPTAAARNLVAVSGSKRIALVIGNDAYQRVSKLEKAGNDAMAMARELKAAGFEVLLHRDLNYRGMVKAVETLANSVTGGDQVVVFFAGHGVQIKTGSYLLPIDIEASSESEVEKTAYGLNDLTEKLSEAKAAFALVMVDACRDNPLKTKGRSIGATRGLSAIEPPKGQMVVYSASKGQQALDRLNDNDSNPNGIFTREFIARMKRPGIRIEDLVREVQDAVEELARSVSHDQRPALYNEARGNFYFFGPTTVQVQPQGGGNVPGPSRARSPEEIEDGYWNSIKDDREAIGFEEYLKQYPKGRYAGQARVMLTKLKAARPPVAVAPAPTIAPAPAPTSMVSSDPETQFWNEVKSSGAREYLDAYLKQYPKGKYVALARIELKKIDERQQQEAQQAEKRAWEQARGENSVVAYGSYLERYPTGNFAALAQVAQQKVQRESAEQEKREAEQRQQDEERQKLAVERARREADDRARQEAVRVADEQRKAREEAARGPQWAESDNGANIDWKEATAYCASKGSGWRLPTVAELQSSYQSGQSTPCGPFTCNVASKSRLTAPFFWSNANKGSSEAWVVVLTSGGKFTHDAEDRNARRALCVRRS